MLSLIKLIFFSLLGLGRLSLKFKGVKARQIKCFGFPSVMGKGEIEVGEGTVLNSGSIFNPVGSRSKIVFAATKNAKITIGKDCGLSNCLIYSHERITIGDRVLIGGGVQIFDTNFHSLDYRFRNDKAHIKRSSVVIGDDVFIGADAIILKGVTIGARSTIGAGAIVRNDIEKDSVVL